MQMSGSYAPVRGAAGKYTGASEKPRLCRKLFICIVLLNHQGESTGPNDDANEMPIKKYFVSSLRVPVVRLNELYTYLIIGSDAGQYEIENYSCFDRLHHLKFCARHRQT